MMLLSIFSHYKYFAVILELKSQEAQVGEYIRTQHRSSCLAIVALPSSDNFHVIFMNYNTG